MSLQKISKFIFKFPNDVQPLERRLQMGLFDGRKRQGGYSVSFSEVRFAIHLMNLKLLLICVILFRNIIEGAGILTFKLKNFIQILYNNSSK